MHYKRTFGKSNDWRVFSSLPFFYRKIDEQWNPFRIFMLKDRSQKKNFPKVIQTICFVWLINNILCTRKCIWTVRICCSIVTTSTDESSRVIYVRACIIFIDFIRSLLCSSIFVCVCVCVNGNKRSTSEFRNQFKWCHPVRRF